MKGWVEELRKLKIWSNTAVWRRFIASQERHILYNDQEEIRRRRVYHRYIVVCQIWPWLAKAGGYRTPNFKIGSNNAVLWRYFALQGRQYPMNKAKFGRAKYTMGIVLYVKFGHDRWGVDSGAQKYKMYLITAILQRFIASQGQQYITIKAKSGKKD